MSIRTSGLVVLKTIRVVILEMGQWSLGTQQKHVKVHAEVLDLWRYKRVFAAAVIQ